MGPTEAWSEGGMEERSEASRAGGKSKLAGVLVRELEGVRERYLRMWDMEPRVQ